MGDTEEIMAKHIKRSVLPIYMVGAAWLIYAALFQLKTPVQYLMCAAVSLAVFVGGKALFPDKSYTMAGEPEEKEPEKPKKKEKPQSTGNPDIDALIKERDRALSEMRRLNDNIQDEKI